MSCLYACVYIIPHLVLSLCKINQAVTSIWGSKQLVCFRHISELSVLKEMKFVKAKEPSTPLVDNVKSEKKPNVVN